MADTGNDRVLLILSAPAPGAGTVLCAAGTQLGKVSDPEGVTVASFVVGPLAGLSTLVVGDTVNSRTAAFFLSKNASSANYNFIIKAVDVSLSGGN